MTEYYEEQLKHVKSRIVDLEKQVVLLQDTVYTMTEQLKDTQRYLIKLAHNQSEVAKHVSSWPFVAVEKGTRKQG